MERVPKRMAAEQPRSNRSRSRRLLPAGQGRRRSSILLPRPPVGGSSSKVVGSFVALSCGCAMTALVLLLGCVPGTSAVELKTMNVREHNDRGQESGMLPWLVERLRVAGGFVLGDTTTVSSSSSASSSASSSSLSTSSVHSRDEHHDRHAATASHLPQRLLQEDDGTTKETNSSTAEEPPSTDSTTSAPNKSGNSTNSSSTAEPEPSPPATNTTTDSSSSFSTTDCRPFGLVPPTPTTRWIIGHRGASAHLPEHSLPSYRLAIELGATFVEPDLVPTKDGNLVAMHTPDLNITTNVADIYGKDRMWKSPFMNLTSWFTFNFTTEELKNLTLKQRLPQARTTLNDNLYSIPTLLEILQLANHWNQVDRAQWSVPVSSATTSVLGDGGAQHAPIGVYAELKDYQWLLEDANMNMVELLLSHMNSHGDDWKQLWSSKAHPCRANHAGLVPPLVVQSFDVSVLEKFHDQWHYSNNSHLPVVGEPPYVLLVSTPNCWSNDFWTQPALMGSSQHNSGGSSNATTSRPAFVVNGIGPDKNCLLDPVQGEPFMNKAQKSASSIAIHPWTERPEFSSLTNLSSSSATSSSSVQELFHLFCECNVSGVFAEAVATAVQVAAIGCPASSSSSTTKPGDSGSAPPPTPTSSAGEDEQGTAGVDCTDAGGGETSAPNSVPASSSSAESSGGVASTPVYVPVLSFLLGVAATLGMVWYWNRRPGSWLGGDMSSSSSGPGRRRRRYRIGSTSLGEDDDDYRNHDLELT